MSTAEAARGEAHDEHPPAPEEIPLRTRARERERTVGVLRGLGVGESVGKEGWMTASEMVRVGV